MSASTDKNAGLIKKKMLHCFLHSKETYQKISAYLLIYCQVGLAEFGLELAMPVT
jgi:hypothetical protein